VGTAAARQHKPPYHAHLGLQIVSIEEGAVTILLPHRQELLNSWGTIHGGAVAGLIDVTLSQTVRSAVPDLKALTTLTMTITYLEPGAGTLTCRGRTTRVGKSIVAAEAELEDEAGSAVARASGTFRVYRLRSDEAPRAGGTKAE
jgi:uncharacterized protein (TIGR00369 family)